VEINAVNAGDSNINVLFDNSYLAW